MQFKYRLRGHFRDFEKIDYVTKERPDSSGSHPRVDCSFGVNPFGCSDKIDLYEAIDKVDLQNYPPFPYEDMEDQVAAYWRGVQRLSREHITVCAGTMLALNSINTLFIDNGDRVLGFSPQFSEYVNSVRIRGGIYESVPLPAANGLEFAADDLIMQLQRGEYKLVYIDNPNNPTGQIIDVEDIERIVARARSLDVCVIVDEAYGDYMDKGNSAISLLGRYDNVFVTRSFSKGHALPGIRIGYVVASEELSACYSIVDDFLLNPVGLELAKTSLRDQPYLERTIQRTSDVKGEIISALTVFNVPRTNNSVPIFVLQHPDPNVDLEALLLSRGIVTTSGFDNLGRNSVRVRIPRTVEPLASALNGLEESLV